MEELGEELRVQKGIGTQQEGQEIQLIWTLRGSQRLNHQPMRIHGLDLGLPHTYIADAQPSLSVGSLQQVQG